MQDICMQPLWKGHSAPQRVCDPQVENPCLNTSLLKLRIALPKEKLSLPRQKHWWCHLSLQNFQRSSDAFSKPAGSSWAQQFLSAVPVSPTTFFSPSLLASRHKGIMGYAHRAMSSGAGERNRGSTKHLKSSPQTTRGCFTRRHMQERVCISLKCDSHSSPFSYLHFCFQIFTSIVFPMNPTEKPSVCFYCYYNWAVSLPPIQNVHSSCGPRWTWGL